jgi:hypothetical protein
LPICPDASTNPRGTPWRRSFSSIATPPYGGCIKEEFTGEGYEVILAKDGKEALRKYKREIPRLVVMDLHLPDADGI